MESGLDVFCEKSMARTLADCRRMVETRQSTGKILQIGHQRLFNPIYLNAIERVRRGEIGKVTQIRAYWHRNNDWRRAVPGTILSWKERSTGECTGSRPRV